MELNIISEWLLLEEGQSLVNPPSLVLSVVAVPEGDMLVVMVLTTVDIKALSSVVLDVSTLLALDPFCLLRNFTSILSDDSSDSDSEALTSLVGESEGSSGRRSDGVGSGIEDPPLLLVLWVMRVDSESVLFSSNIFGNEDRVESVHSGSDLELDLILKWVSWVVETLLVINPTLVWTIVACPPDNVTLVGIASSVNIEASLSKISDVSSLTIEPSDSHQVVIGLEGSDDSVWTISIPVILASLNGNSLVSVGLGSDSSSSPVESEPLLDVIWVEVLDSESILLSSNVFSNVESSSRLHLSSDLELDTLLEWIFWEFNTLSVKEPSLRSMSSADVPVDLVVVVVTSSKSS